MKDLEELLREDAREMLPDAGFTQRVMGALPAPVPRTRPWLTPMLVLGSTALGSVLAMAFAPQGLSIAQEPGARARHRRRQGAHHPLREARIGKPFTRILAQQLFEILHFVSLSASRALSFALARRMWVLTVPTGMSSARAASSCERSA